MSVGIDKIAYYCPEFFTTTKNLSENLKIKYEAVIKTSGQFKNAICSQNEDIISFGLNAARQIIQREDKFDFVIFATESSFDDSKSCGLYLSEYLNINKNAIFFEIKQACYASTAALIFAMNYVKNNKNAKILIIASDIAKYEPKSTGEITNGAGAIAFIVSENPKIIEIESKFHSIHSNEYDFFKPKDLLYPVVEGSKSVNLYLEFFEKLYEENKIKADKKDLIIIPHLPFANMFDKISNLFSRKFEKELQFKEEIKKYTSQIGNIYTGSLYLSLVSLLKNINEDLSNKNIIFFAYGSGATASLFQGKILTTYKEEISKIEDYISSRIEINYEDLNLNHSTNRKNIFILEKIQNYKRYYKLND